MTLFRCTILCLAFAATSAQAEVVEHRGVAFHVYRLDPAKERLELHLSDKKGEPNTFLKLAEKVKGQNRELKFAMNSGIFEKTHRPSGLHIAEGKTITKLNTKDFVKEHEGQFTPNFFLKPNGVFYLFSDGTAGVSETGVYSNLKLDPILATQSGPLLVNHGVIHPVFGKDSTSKKYRNGVGVTGNGMVILVCSVLDPELGLTNFQTFAELFRDKLKCPDALYLDGVISDIYIKGETQLRERNWFAGILAITEPAP
ncbi:MAG: phosphodiester glycosidase family protein [Verrucomicrobiales bacterium]|nr:phosphodiester glycosidase family protein [Verrucomicrobiales bacterium]